jgi:hypothetical protein
MKFTVVEFAMSELSAGQWQAKQTLNERLHFRYGETPSYNYMFQASQTPAFSLQVNTYTSGNDPDSGWIGSSVAQATLQSPDSQLAAIVDASNFPDVQCIDLDQEPTYSLITNKLTIEALLVPGNYIYQAQDLVWNSVSGSPVSVPLQVFAQPHLTPTAYQLFSSSAP